MTDTTTAVQNGFSGLGIAPTLLTILEKLSYTVPTPIQHQSIPVAISGSDVIGIAQTGTGKTLAFGIPMIQRLAQFKGRGLVILPTRELALQVEENLKKLGSGIGMRTVVLIGGASMHLQKQALLKNPHVIIATPGRLIDHLEQKTITLKDVKILVLDEADRMLDMGFAPQINKILAAVPKDRQTMLFSATMPLEIVRIANTAMRTPVRVEVAPQGTSSERVEQEIFFIAKHDKDRLLELCLKETEGTALVFTRTKYGAKKVARIVRAMGHTADELHANRSLAQRKAALEGFKTGKYRVLVATDIAARGIDVKGIALV
ncbi:MAG: DEAD/DEAH box helicase, partial [Patescibacteria group bacterium]